MGSDPILTKPTPSLFRPMVKRAAEKPMTPHTPLIDSTAATNVRSRHKHSEQGREESRASGGKIGVRLECH
jgi:hypothetical protein